MSSIFRSWIQLPPGIQQWKEQHAMVRCRACMKIIFFLDAGRLLRDKGIQLSWRKFRYVSAFIFKPSGTLNGPTSSLPITPAQNMTPPPHCCRLTLDGLLQPFTSQPLHQPFGPLRVALHSSFEPIRLQDFRIRTSQWRKQIMWKHCAFCLKSLVVETRKCLQGCFNVAKNKFMPVSVN